MEYSTAQPKCQLTDTSTTTINAPSLQETKVQRTKSTNRESTKVPSKRSKDLLEQWYNSNKHYPYPSLDVINYLARNSNSTIDKVKRWFCNRRYRDKNTRKLSKLAQLENLPYK